MSAMLTTVLLILVRSRVDITWIPMNQKVVPNATDVHSRLRNSMDPTTSVGMRFSNWLSHTVYWQKALAVILLEHPCVCVTIMHQLLIWLPVQKHWWMSCIFFNGAAWVAPHWNTCSKMVALKAAKTQIVLRLVWIDTMRPWWQIFLLSQQQLGDILSIIQLLVMETVTYPFLPSSSPGPTQPRICNLSKETDNT